MSYVLSKTGAQIDAILNKAAAGGVIEKSAATFADINAAIALGSPVIIKDGSDLYQYSTSMGTTLFFTQMSTLYNFVPGPYLKYLTLTNANVWSSGVMSLQDALTFDSTPTDGSTNPVTSDGIYEAIKAGVADSLITDTVQGAIASFPDGADNVPVKSLIAQITPVQAGSGDPSPDNIRPISGWTGAKINVTGINVWDEEWEVGYINGSGVNQPANDAFRSKNYIAVVPNSEYYFVSPMSTSATRLVVHWYDASKTHISAHYLPNYGTGATTSPNNAYYMRFTAGSLSTPVSYGNNISVNYPSSDHDYHAYNGNTINVDWTDEAGTVYGGTLNVTTGLLTVTHKIVKGTNSNITRTNAGQWQIVHSIISDALVPASNQGLLSDTFKSVVDITVGGCLLNIHGGIRFTTSADYNDAAALIAAIGAPSFVYPLATPQTYQLTPTEVKTLLGDNNIFTDCSSENNAVDVTYRADTALYIDKKLGQ